MKQQTKDIINIGGSIALVLAVIIGIIFAIFALRNVPKDPKPEPDPKTEEARVIWYDYGNGAWGTRSHDPFTGAKGEVITLEELETLKLAE